MTPPQKLVRDPYRLTVLVVAGRRRMVGRLARSCGLFTPPATPPDRTGNQRGKWN